MVEIGKVNIYHKSLYFFTVSTTFFQRVFPDNLTVYKWYFSHYYLVILLLQIYLIYNSLINISLIRLL
jgi:hypothetical protein